MVDDLEPLVTQCPNCDTRFRVNEQQLQAAHGQVRCGACLTVFEGTAYLLVDGELIEGEREDVDALLSEIQSAEDSLEADDEEGLDSAVALEDSPMITELQERSEAGDAELEALEAALMAELKGEPTAEQSTEKRVEVDVPSVDVLQRVARELQDEPIFSLVDDPGSVELGKIEPEHETTNGNESLTDESLVEQAGKEEESIDEAGMEEAPWMAPHSTHAVDTGFPDRFYDDEPVRRSWITWAFVVLALFALPAQVLWYQFSTWSKNDTMRPVYAEICSVLGCQLPVLRNVGLITAKNSVLRNHPDVEEALIYDALLVNQATFDQPYPLVELTLTTIQGHLVATRRFTPTEYLAGEAATSQMMPALTPVHISLALKDPGAAPLNFRVRFLSAD